MSQTAALVSTLVQPFTQPVTRTARLARSNAMLAATDLTDRRRQTLLVEEYLAGYTARWEAGHAALAAPLAAEG